MGRRRRLSHKAERLINENPDKAPENPKEFERWAELKTAARTAEIEDKMKKIKKQGPTRLIRFLRRYQIAIDGIRPQIFEQGQAAELPEALAIELCKSGAAELLKQFNEPPLRK